MWRKTLNSLLKDPTGNMVVQALRYAVSGGVAFVADFLLLYVLTDCAHVHYLLSAILSFCVGLLITYLLSVYWIFDKRRFDSRVPEIIIFVLIGLVGLLITALFMWLFTDLLQIHYLLSKVLTTFVSTVWNFLAKKFMLFSDRKGR